MQNPAVGRHLRLTIYVLLLALFCSLGDGPFVDEVMADEHPDQAVQVVQADRADSSSQDSLLIVYATLMNVAFNEQNALPAARKTSQRVPTYRASRYSPPKLSPPDKPPRLQV